MRKKMMTSAAKTENIRETTAEITEISAASSTDVTAADSDKLFL